MGVEIERKFLLVNEQWRLTIRESRVMRQGYIVGSEKASVRVRVAGKKANLNIKSAQLGVFRKEYEIDLALSDANEMLDSLCQGPLIEKTRHFVPFADHLWEVDEFHGDNQGLVVAEIELKAVDETFAKPAWVGEEVSDDPRYYNVSLVKHPFKDW